MEAKKRRDAEKSPDRSPSPRDRQKKPATKPFELKPQETKKDEKKKPEMKDA